MYRNGERMMAWIAKIDDIKSIENADQIVTYRVGGWCVVDKNNLYKIGDLVIYISIDSWVPSELAPFLSKGKEPREFNGVKGERLRTIKLKGQISQGLLLPLSVLGKPEEIFAINDDSVNADVTEQLGIQKWEKPIPAQLAGLVKGNFPTAIPKTDQERVQNIAKQLPTLQGSLFEVTEKLEGSSMTCYLLDDVFGVCSRNLDLKRDENNAFWKTASKYNIEAKMRSLNYADFAIQGELIGPGVQGNIYNLTDLDFYVFDIYNVKKGEYLTPEERHTIIKKLNLKHVPVLETYKLGGDIDEILTKAEGKSVLNSNQEREGIVFKDVAGGITFKAISNRYLIKTGE